MFCYIIIIIILGMFCRLKNGYREVIEDGEAKVDSIEMNDMKLEVRIHKLFLTLFISLVLTTLFITLFKTLLITLFIPYL